MTRKVASKKHENKENVDTESALRNKMPFALPAPKTPFAKNRIEAQVQTIPFQTPGFQGTLNVTNENLKLRHCLGSIVNSNMNTVLVYSTHLFLEDLTFLPYS